MNAIKRANCKNTLYDIQFMQLSRHLIELSSKVQTKHLLKSPVVTCVFVFNFTEH